MNFEPPNASLKALKEFPRAPTGYGDIDYEFVELDLRVTYHCTDQNGVDRVGTLVFEFCVAHCIESETNRGGSVLPPDADTLFGFPSDMREGFSGYKIWFSNNQVITAICERVLVDNEEF